MAFHNLYSRVVTGLGEEARAQIDSLLGMSGAEDRLLALRSKAVSTAGFEVG